MEYDRYCDLTMRGGTTSGVVYPLAVASLARHYEFKQIGGASAGAIAAAFTAAAERGRFLAVVLFDLDSFKQYNDTYGHQAGDEALQLFASVLAQTWLGNVSRVTTRVPASGRQSTSAKFECE